MKSLNDAIFEWAMQQEGQREKDFYFRISGGLDMVVGTGEEILSHLDTLEESVGGAKEWDKLFSESKHPYVVGLIGGMTGEFFLPMAAVLAIGLAGPLYAVGNSIWRGGRSATGGYIADQASYPKGSHQRRVLEYPVGFIGTVRELYATGLKFAGSHLPKMPHRKSKP